MTEKIAKALRLIKDCGADGVLVSDPANIRYLSGYTNDTGVLFLSEKECCLLTDFRFLYQALDEAKGFRVIDIGRQGYERLIGELCMKNSVKKLAFEKHVMTYREYESYRENVKAELVPCDNILATLRFIKTKEEIELLRTAEHIGDMAFSEILPYLKPGVTELEIAARLAFSMKMHGASGESFPAIVASGVNSSMPHAIPSERKIQNGDFVTMDFGCVYKGYCSDMTRTVVLGKASDRQKEIYETVLKAQTEALKALKPGKKGREIDAVARDIITEAGYGDCFGHGLGHSVGLQIHEDPNCNMREERVLQAGMIMTVEPGIYVQDFGGVRIEDMVVLTEDGYENLAHSEKKLIEL